MASAGAGRRPPQPETKYCIMIPIRVDATQYTTRPNGKNRLNIPNITGNMNSIIRWVLAWVGSVEGIWLIFC